MSTHMVKIFYGPTETFYTLSHKPEKLYGLRDRLRRLGYRVLFRPVDFLDYCAIEMCGHEVFRCNFNYLAFNTTCDKDPICQRAVDAVLDATDKFNYARTYLWTWTLIENQMFNRSEYAPKDYWQRDVKFEPFSLDCVKCCDILVAKKSEEKTGVDKTVSERLISGLIGENFGKNQEDVDYDEMSLYY